ncbi:peptidoglycan-binding protein lysin domain-containing protein [Strigomonas culicis]|uniref:Peptidoglycan-binding protein lysin domain-containing protein n=1 Tax=Strigomonas culicis TaxID=28005 RepID=S9TLA2_9TRYP|nr:peptidoglycan-binding protein lysin domain-containing protein [Strigomonas culicis]|eukprot:EPY17103.1 peptidoglycan-binding protein lysin domain-containing protein [Strigomonas culicis]
MLVQALRGEKEVLERQVHELERANGEIQQQVASFTLELQNDPLIKSAKETQARAQQLQEELVEAREEVQRLRDRLRDKEEEMGRYQMDILRSQLVLGGAAGAAGGPPTAEQAALRDEYASLRQSYETLCAQFEKERVRRHQRRSSRKAASVSSSASRSSSSSSNHAARRRRRRRGASTRPAPPPLPDAASAGTPSASYLLQEAELWRQKYLQLEQHLRTLLTERDRLRRELRVSQEAAAALQSEKQSLLDLNALLKAQLREASRLNSVAAAAPHSPSRASGVIAGSPGANQSRSVHTPELTEAERAYQNQQQRFAVDAVQPPSAPPGRGGVPSADVSQERLIALEEDIQMIKSQIAETRQRSAQHASRSATSLDKGRRPPSPLQPHTANDSRSVSRATAAASTSSPSIVRKKGNSLIRNYAYQ